MFPNADIMSLCVVFVSCSSTFCSDYDYEGPSLGLFGLKKNVGVKRVQWELQSWYATALTFKDGIVGKEHNTGFICILYTMFD